MNSKDFKSLQLEFAQLLIAYGHLTQDQLGDGAESIRHSLPILHQATNRLAFKIGEIRKNSGQ